MIKPYRGLAEVQPREGALASVAPPPMLSRVEGESQLNSEKSQRNQVKIGAAILKAICFHWKREKSIKKAALKGNKSLLPNNLLVLVIQMDLDFIPFLIALESGWSLWSHCRHRAA